MGDLFETLVVTVRIVETLVAQPDASLFVEAANRLVPTRHLCRALQDSADCSGIHTGLTGDLMFGQALDVIQAVNITAP